MVRRFGCSTSTSYDDDNRVVTTDYSDDSYDFGGHDSKASGLFQEAEEMINRGLQTLLNAGTISCGLDPFPLNNKGGQKGKGRGGSGFDIDEGVKPDWRKDPYHSMSDWTLIVRDGSQRPPQTYHIHKSVVSYGKRSSGFFVKVFQRDIMENGGSSSGRRGGSTEIALPKRASQFVPQLFDYIYSDKLDLNADCAPSLRHLANLFDVRELYALVSSFIQNDLSESTITTYIREAESVKDKELLDFGMALAANKFNLLPDDAILQLQPHIFQQLTSNPQLNCPSSERLSQRVAVYVRGRSTEINDEVFYFMTHAQILPTICSSEAMWYLNFAASKFGNVLVDDSMGGYKGTLKRRCIVAAAQDWRDILVESVRQEVKRKIDGGDIPGSTSGDNPRRRLFVDSDDETKMDKGRGYLSLPMDIRVELLEEALLNAAAIEPTNVPTNPNHIGRRMLSNMSESEMEHMLATQSVTEDRGDVGVGKRETRRGRRENRLMV